MESEEVQRLILQADAHYDLANLNEALDLYTEVIHHDQSMAWPYSRIGAILAQTGEPEHAEEAFNRALALDPSLPQAHSNLGNLCYARGDFRTALEKYQAAVTLDPDNPIFHENLHAAYKKLHRYSDAVRALKQAHRLTREGAKRDTATKVNQLPHRAKGRMGCLTLLLPILVISLSLWLLV